MTQLRDGIRQTQLKHETKGSTVRKYEDLTARQQLLHNDVQRKVDWTGEDTRDVLIRTEGTAQDKAAVAEVFGGPGAGDEFLR